MKRFFPTLALILCLGAPAMAADAPAPAESKPESSIIRIGVLTDLSGSMAGAAGRGSIEAAEMAMEDAAHFSDRQVALISGDYQSRSDLAQHISEDWIKRQNVDMVVDVPNTVIAGRLQDLFHDQGKILLSSTPLRPEDASSACGMNGLFWLYDRETLAMNLIHALIADHKIRWFVIGGDTVYAANIANLVKNEITKNNGQIVGEAYLGPRFGGLAAVAEQIKAAHADVAFLALERQDTLHVLKHWPDDTLSGLPPLAVNTLHISDLQELKDKVLPPFYTTSSFYWNQDAATRSFSDRFAARNRGMMPTAIHASVYSAVYHYLRSVHATGRKTADVVLAHMKTQALQDGFFNGGRIRADGVVMHPVQLLFLKTPKERESAFDYFRVMRSLNMGDEIAPPQVSCPAAAH